LRARCFLTGALVAAVAVLGLGSAVAAPPEITIAASRRTVTAGEVVVLRGLVRSAERADLVRIVNQRGRVVGTGRTDARGRYSLRVRPSYAGAFRARSRGAVSRPVALRVRARVKARLRWVPLFGDARVSGRVRPARAGGHAWVRIMRNGRPLLRRRVTLRGDTRFAFRFRVGDPGSYRAIVRFDDARHAPSSDATVWRKTRLPRLAQGARARGVVRLERRLEGLGYHLRGVNRSFDYRTADALRAFHKVQHMDRTPVATEATWRALASPRRPRPRARRPRFHIEVDQSRQVLYAVRRGRIRKILHTSTGLAGATRDGVWRVHRKLEGYSPGRLYYPSYFDGLRAIHGWPDVPPSPRSHGCARVPMWAAKWIYRQVSLGTQVRIYH
jgi:L,D-transpeptidase catalytic domain